MGEKENIHLSYNTYWYLGLSLLSIILLVYVCLRHNTVSSLLQCLIMVQIAYSIDTVIYIFLGSYQYHPKVLKSYAFYDSNIGALASNMLTVPVIATFLTTFQMGWLWKLVFIGLLALIEWLFIKLHIYTLFWWRIEYTSLGLPLFFAAAKRVYPHILRPTQGWLHALLLFLCSAPILGTFHILPIMVFQNRFYHPGWFTDPAHDTTAFSSIYYILGTIIVIVCVTVHLKYEWIKLCLLAFTFYILAFVLTQVKILDSRVWWDPYYYILFPLLVYFISKSISKRLSSGPQVQY